MHKSRLICLKLTAVSTALAAYMLLTGCSPEASLRGRMIGTWESRDDLYRTVITYHSDGTWALTSHFAGRPEDAKEEDNFAKDIFDLARVASTGAVMKCSGTWKIADGRLLVAVTASDSTQKPAGLLTSDEVVSVNPGVMEVRTQAGDIETWQRVKYPIPASQPTSAPLR